MGSSSRQWSSQSAIAEAADRGFDPGPGEARGVPDRHVLRPAIAMMNQAAGMNRPSIVSSACTGVSSTKPACAVLLARQPTIRRGVGVDDEACPEQSRDGEVDKPRPGRDTGDPKGGEANFAIPTACSVPAHGTGGGRDRAGTALPCRRCGRAPACLGSRLPGPSRASAVRACIGRQEKPSPILCRHTLRTPVDRDVLGEHTGDLGLEEQIPRRPR